MEIEKKFLVKTIPFDLSNYKFDIISQAYICTSPVIRIRHKNSKYYLTCKSKGLLARQEFEIEITQEEFMKLKNKIDYHIITKKRYYIPHNNLKIELDIFEDQLKGFILAEVEFSTMEEANAYIPPDWFGTEVTNISQYHNSNLCQLDNINKLHL